MQPDKLVNAALQASSSLAALPWRPSRAPSRAPKKGSGSVRTAEQDAAEAGREAFGDQREPGSQANYPVERHAKFGTKVFDDQRESRLDANFSVERHARARQSFVRHYPKKRFAFGDPQSSRQQFFSMLAHHQLLGEDGFLSKDVAVVSIGDHFDYPGASEEVAREGFLILRWLAEHPREQVTLLVGNHDLCRVMELAPLSDEDFSLARSLAIPLKAAEKAGEDVTERERAFYARFPSLPSPGIAAKDFLGFSAEQRRLVQSLLLEGRLQLAQRATLSGGQEALLTHALVTHRELSLLGAPAHPETIAERLNEALRVAVERVRPHWESGQEHTPLDLAPLHIAGTAGQEGGGLLYHRPSHPNRPGADLAWEFSSGAPRRFDPRTLPTGLVQVCGHTGHAKCLQELGDWVSESARQFHRGGPRTLRADAGKVSYEWGLSLPKPEEATAYMIDAELHSVPAAHYPLLALAAL